MSSAPSPTFQALVLAAVEATSAASGWLLRADGAQFEVVAGLGANGDVAGIGIRRNQVGIAGYTLASGHPAAVRISPGDADNSGAGNSANPGALLAAPCTHDSVLGVLELAAADGQAFSFDDVETVSLLADVAGAALFEPTGAQSPPPPTPAMLGASLSGLASSDPERYQTVARAVAAML